MHFMYTYRTTTIKKKKNEAIAWLTEEFILCHANLATDFQMTIFCANHKEPRERQDTYTR